MSVYDKKPGAKLVVGRLFIGNESIISTVPKTFDDIKQTEQSRMTTSSEHWKMAQIRATCVAQFRNFAMNHDDSLLGESAILSLIPRAVSIASSVE